MSFEEKKVGLARMDGSELMIAITFVADLSAAENLQTSSGTS